MVGQEMQVSRQKEDDKSSWVPIFLQFSIE